jgi:hypothetical protein
MTAKFNEISQKRISLKEKHMPFLPHMRWYNHNKTVTLLGPSTDRVHTRDGQWV